MKPYFKKYTKLTIFLALICMICSAITLFLTYLMSQQLLAISNHDVSKIIKITVLIIITVLCVHHVLWFLWEWIAGKISNKVAYNLRSDFVSKLVNTKYQSSKENSSGFYLERLNDDITQVSKFFTNVIGTIIDFSITAGFLVLIYLLSWQIGLVFSVGIVILFIIESIKVKVDVKNLEQIKISTDKNNSNLNEVTNGIKDIKGLGIKNEVLKKTNRTNSLLERYNIKRLFQGTLLSRISTAIQWILDCSIVLICAFWLIPSRQVTATILILFLNYKGHLYHCVGYFSQLKQWYEQGDFQSKRILEVTENEDADNFGNENISIKNAEIYVKELSFCYQNNKKSVLDEISFNVKTNSCSVFVGSSGSGKSTLFGLLSKLLDAKDNTIFIGGYDINSFSEESFRDTLCIVNQETFIFNDTVFNNIKIVKPTATQEEIESACKKANIHHEILGFANGYQTLLSENGANLSGGQKQRIAIARAILKDTPIILFDEPTSALDKENQALFFATLEKLKKSKIILVIAHKLNSYEAFDNVFTLKNGRIE